MLVALSCGGDPVDPGPPVSAVTVSPASSFLDLNATTRLMAVASTSTGTELSDVELTWRSSSAAATVDETGLVTAVSPGEAVIEAEAHNGVVGSATIKVTPVESLAPDTGRYGGTLTLAGDGFAADTRVYFTAAAGGTVRAFTRTASSDAIEVFIPVGADDGPIHLAWAGDSVATSSTFTLTAEQDVYASLGAPATIPFPFHNPSLLATSAEPHELHFTLAAPSPFSLQLADRGEAFLDVAARYWLFRTDTEPSTLVAFGITRDQLDRSAVLDSVAYGRDLLPAGDYALVVAALDLHDETSADVSRPFGLTLTDGASFQLGPDDREPDDYPAEAATVALPYTGTQRRLENPFAMDHYPFDIAATSDVTITTTADDSLLLVYVIPDGHTDILAAWDAAAVQAEADGSAASQTVQATLPPGRYTALVWDWGGRSRRYDIGITAAPAAAAGIAPATANAPRPAAGPTAPAARLPDGTKRPAAGAAKEIHR